MASTAPAAIEGEVSFDVPSVGKLCKTWYKIYGDLSSSATGRPLVVLHGGPGACHNYLLPLADLAAGPHHIPIVLYDQIGNGKSTHLREKRLDAEFWVPDLFMKELDNLLHHLGIQKDYDLLGQSWGGMLGSMWAMSGYEGAKGMKRLIISNSPSSMLLWVESCNSLRKYLPREVDDALERHERDQTYKDPEYEEAVMVFYKKHLCRVVPFPDYVQDTLNLLDQDDTTYFTM